MTFRSGLKVAAFSTIALLVLVVVLIVALLYADPTRLKEQIESLAAQRGVELRLHGDIGWAIYPDIQMIVRGATARYQNETTRLDADIGYFSFAVKPWPLLHGNLEFVGAEIAEADIELEMLETDTPAPNEQAELNQRLIEISQLLPRTAIADLTLKEVSINVLRPEESNLAIRVQQFHAENLSTDGQPFPVTGKLAVSTLPPAFQTVQFDGYVAIDPLGKLYNADLAEMSLGGGDAKSAISMLGSGRTNLDLNRNLWSLDLNLADAGVAGVGASLSGALSPFNAIGRVEANTSDLNALKAAFGSTTSPVAVQPAATMPVTIFALDSDLEISNEVLNANNLRLRINDDSGRGSIRLGTAEPFSATIDVSFQSLDLDAYFPATSGVPGAKPEPIGGLTADQLDQLSTLQNFVANLSVGSLRAKGKDISDLKLNLSLNKGAGQFKLSSAKLADGQLSGSAVADFAKSKNVSKIVLSISGMDLNKLTAKNSSAGAAQGLLNLTYTGSLDRLQSSQILDGLQGSGRLEVKSLVMPSTNVERMLCESAELVGATPSAVTDWPSGSVLGDVATDYVVQNGVARVEGTKLAYGNMNSTATANFNLLDSEFALSAELKVAGTKTSAKGCNLNKYVQGVQLPLKCSGNISAGRPVSCGLDASVAERLVIQQVGGKLIENVLGRLAEEEGAGTNSGETTGTTTDANRNQLRAILEGMLKDIDK